MSEEENAAELIKQVASDAAKLGKLLAKKGFTKQQAAELIAKYFAEEEQ